jgi:hypothetical protein
MASPRPSSLALSRDDEHRLIALRARDGGDGEPLTPAEQQEFIVLGRKQEQFHVQGSLDLARAKPPLPADGENGTNSSPTIGSAIGSVFKTATSAGIFWGSLAATAGPGYVGRKIGLTEDFKHWDWITDKLILGALPVVSKVGSSGDHLSQIAKQCEARGAQIGLVVSCLTKPEMEGFGVGFPRFANHRDWADQLGVFNAELLEITDMCAEGADHAEIARVVERMKTIATELNGVSYVHCKAGKGRSWMVTMCYLTTQEGMPFEVARKLVKLKRHQVSPSASQVCFAQDFLVWYNGNREAQLKYQEAQRRQQTNAGGDESSSASPPPLAEADAGLAAHHRGAGGQRLAEARSRQDLDRMAGTQAAADDDDWVTADAVPGTEHT